MDRLLAQFGNREAFQKMAEIHRDLTLDLQRRTSEKLDLVLWPEGAYPYPFPNARPEHQMLADLTARLGAALVTGGNAQQREPVFRYFNAMVLIEPGRASASAIYKKHILLAFGEYVPLSNLFPVLKNLIPAISDFGAGPGPEIISYQDIKAAAVICYEVLEPHFLRQYARKGANLILNVTNDSWFGKLQEPEQHLALAQLRCVETRKAQVRSTNTGISAIVWPNGEITHRTSLHEPAVFAAKVPLMEMPPTLYVRWGDWWAGVMALMVVTLRVWRAWKPPA
jgi:apolipoprotein N-acyltransferase